MRSFPTLLLLALPLPLLAQEWTQFRGPNGSGVSRATDLTTNWDEKTNVVWKTPVHGKGWSSPVIWGDQVWLTTAPPDGTKRHALCIDRDSGKVVKDLEVFATPDPKKLYTMIDF